jgi:hypothetical protein
MCPADATSVSRARGEFIAPRLRKLARIAYPCRSAWGVLHAIPLRRTSRFKSPFEMFCKRARNRARILTMIRI